MTTCPGSALSPIGLRPCRARLAAAVCVSALLHVVLANRLTGGPAGEPIRRALAPFPITAHLVPLPPAPAEPESLPIFVEPEVAHERAPRPAVRKVTPAQAAVDAAAPDRAKPPGHTYVEGPDPTYYASRQLDTFPALRSALDLRHSGNGGRALLLVLIDELGSVRAVSVVEAEAAGEIEHEATRALMSAQFTPAQRNGRAVKARVLVQVTFGDDAAAK
jgi:protein TonB